MTSSGRPRMAEPASIARAPSARHEVISDLVGMTFSPLGVVQRVHPPSRRARRSLAPGRVLNQTGARLSWSAFTLGQEDGPQPGHEDAGVAREGGETGLNHPRIRGTGRIARAGTPEERRHLVRPPLDGDRRLEREEDGQENEGYGLVHAHMPLVGATTGA